VTLVFHIATRAACEDGLAAGRYAAPSLAAEGFIHCARAEQVAAVGNARFAGARDLVLLWIDVDRLDAPLVTERGEVGGEDYPHLYGTLDPSAVVRVTPFAEGDGGFPAPAPS
jgi:uncharacterized protein (DUF952 family)